MGKHAVFQKGDFLVCLGGGYFGTKAARLGRKCKARTLIIDTNPDCAAREIADVVSTTQGAIKAGQVWLIIGDSYRGQHPDVVVRHSEQGIPDRLSS